MAILNLGILAHVDAGKTSLTERILFETGAIAAPGSVDRGTTQTDALALERARGISIKAAVAAFQLGDLHVNLIDTPGHADFVAEVERALRVLDAVVLVVSAVEGVQPQTRRLMAAIRAAGLPVAVFINKVDRLGARGDELGDEIRRKLDLRVAPLTAACNLGSRAANVTARDRDDPAWQMALADLLAETSERVIAEFERNDGAIGRAFLEAELRTQIAAGDAAPLFFGSAITGAGVPELLAGFAEWLPRAVDASEAPLDGLIFKIARRPSGEKIVHARLFAGRLAVRDRLVINRRDGAGEAEPFEERVTGLDRFVPGGGAAGAGEIVTLHGLREARIGDRLGGGAGRRELGAVFPAPALESVVAPAEPSQLMRLRIALDQLAEQDPLISLRQSNEEGEIAVRLFGEVQKEVLTDTLALDYGLTATFGPSRTICVERPVGVGEHIELMGEAGNPFVATVGFRVEPGEIGSGIAYARELGSLPLAFYRAIEETARETLTQGLHGWEVTDCRVTLTEVAYSSPVTVAADFRKLVPLVLLQALARAGTVVCEPMEDLEVELPEDAAGPVCAALIQARATILATDGSGARHRIIGRIPTAELRGVEQRLPRLTRGEGGWSARFTGFVPVSGGPPSRPRIGSNPLNRAHYLAETARA